MKKFLMLVIVSVAILGPALPLSATRTWLPEPLRVTGQPQPMTCLEHPTLALQLGSMPVVSTNGEMTGSPSPVSIRRTPFGWEYYGPGYYAAGNGSRTLVSNNTPVNLGADGYFYSSISSTGGYAMSTRGGAWVPVTTAFPYGSGYTGQQPGVSADATGKIYMVAGSNLAMYSGGAWSSPLNLDTTLGMKYISELAVSPYGEVALSGYSSSGNTKMVAWFDYKTAGWATRNLTSGYNNLDTIGLEWDKFGNLGVAYSDNYSGNGGTRVKFDYLDIGAGLWSSETVLDNSTAPYGFKGAALAFDRFNNPVIACGQYLIYDPVVPEPVTLLLVLVGAGLVTRRRSA